MIAVAFLMNPVCECVWLYLKAARIRFGYWMAVNLLFKCFPITSVLCKLYSIHNKVRLTRTLLQQMASFRCCLPSWGSSIRYIIGSLSDPFARMAKGTKWPSDITTPQHQIQYNLCVMIRNGLLFFCYSIWFLSGYYPPSPVIQSKGMIVQLADL